MAFMAVVLPMLMRERRNWMVVRRAMQRVGIL